SPGLQRLAVEGVAAWAREGRLRAGLPDGSAGGEGRADRAGAQEQDARDGRGTQGDRRAPQQEREQEVSWRAATNELLGIEKFHLVDRLKGCAGELREPGPQIIDTLAAALPVCSLARVLESARSRKVGAGYVINALRSEQL